MKIVKEYFFFCPSLFSPFPSGDVDKIHNVHNKKIFFWFRSHMTSKMAHIHDRDDKNQRNTNVVMSKDNMNSNDIYNTL